MAVKQVILAGVSLGMIAILVQTANGQPVLGSDVLGSLDSALGGLTGMTKLNAQQIATVAANAGFSGDDLVTAVAIALAESGGETGAYNPVKNFDSGRPANTPSGKGAIGLWQIYLNVHPEFSGINLNDPNNNAMAAFSIYQAAGMSFTPWTTYTNGRYESFLSTAQSAVNA